MIESIDLKKARDLIAGRFIAQCKSGPQVRDLPNTASSCGQFLDDTMSSQRGLHGSAAAIRVLAEDGRQESRVLIPKLIRYVEDRNSTEQNVTPSDFRGSGHDHLERDDSNVIKVSEVLLALKFVDGAVCDTEKLRKRLADKLLGGMINSNGWGYFLDRPTGEPQLLPTAHAVRALAEHGYQVDEPLKQLLGALITKSSGDASTRADISVRVFCLYVLAFIKNSETIGGYDKVPKVFTSIWRQLESLLDGDIEQNIEYSRDHEHYYVRVPWQLYLLALAAKLAPKRRFASRAAQSRLKAILTAVNSPVGFTYPHSGLRVSSRTNAILYDVFSSIENQLERTWQVLLAPAQTVDLLRTFLSSRWVRIPTALTTLVVIVVSLFSWHNQGGHLGELAPELLAGFLLLLITAGKAR